MMAREGLAGVGEELPTLGKNSPDLGKMTESMSVSRNPPHHDVEFDEINSMVVSVCTGSPRFRRKSSPERSSEFSRCKSLARVIGS
jgi:hypothetical protein